MPTSNILESCVMTGMTIWLLRKIWMWLWIQSNVKCQSGLPNECDYDMTDPDDQEDYYKKIEEISDETCWTVNAAYSECMP